MKKQQIFLLTGALVLLLVIFLFGNTTPPADKQMATNKPEPSSDSNLTTEAIINTAKTKLTDKESSDLTVLENSVVRGDVKSQKIEQFKHLANYWDDTLKRHDIGAVYFAEAAKLENSEKNLNFAARLFFNMMMEERDESVKKWQATNAKDLYELVLAANPANDSAKVELGACYLFGNISAMPMEGIVKIKEVAERDTTNMYAQLLLGLADIKSMQYDKAIERLKLVAAHEPSNLQAIFNLAETYERKGDKVNAVLWYRKIETMISDPGARNELEQRINSLQ